MSFVSLLTYLQAAQESGTNTWGEEIQEAVVGNFSTFLSLFRSFTPPNAALIYAKFSFSLDQNNFPEQTFHRYLFGVVFRPESLIKGMSRDMLSGEKLKLYLYNYVNYLAIR